MRVLYIEGVAIRGGPESCVVVCEDGGEALTGVCVGWAIEPRNLHLDRGADALLRSGRPCRWRRYRESLGGPARSENLGTHGSFMRENREVPRSPVPEVLGAGRNGKAEAVIR